MKKGEAGLTMIISVVVLIIIILQYFIFFVWFPDIIQPKSTQNIQGGEAEVELLTFVKLNSNLILTSVKNNNYVELNKNIESLDWGLCWRIKINDKTFQSEHANSLVCASKTKYSTNTNIPDYYNNNINIILELGK